MAAKTLTPDQLAQLLAFPDRRKAGDPLRDKAVILLSFRAGLRAAEIAGLSWLDIQDAVGALADTVTVPASIAKKGHARSIPMHNSLRAALAALQARSAPSPGDPVIRGRDGSCLTANALQRYLSRLYTHAGLQGCSSHSGRRTFITGMARTANAHNCSIRDVQRISGHRHLSSIAPYLEPSEGTAAMVRAL